MGWAGWIRWCSSAVVVVVVAAAVSASSADAAARSAPPDQAIGYWTADRVAAARPLEVALDHHGRRVTPAPRSHDGTGPTNGTPWPDDATEPIDDLVGRLLFTLGGGDYVCSASTVDSGGPAWVLLTAGHCVWDDQLGAAQNLVFVPDYEDVLAFGCTGATRETNEEASCYAAESLHPATGWTTPGDDYDHDVAFVRMDVDPPASLYAGVDLPQVSIDAAIGTEVTALGYPAAQKYSGTDLIQCAGTTDSGPGLYSTVAMLACDMTGGSSGGPWFAEDDDAHVVVSLNSFGLRSLNGFMFGPVFDTQALAALGSAAGTPPIIRPKGAVVTEGDSGTTIAELVVEVSRPAQEDLAVQWSTVAGTANPQVARAGEDFVAAAGTLTIPAGSTVATVPVEVIGDTVAEPPLLWGEWGLVAFSSPSRGATLDTSFFGLALLIIIDDD